MMEGQKVTAYKVYEYGDAAALELRAWLKAQGIEEFGNRKVKP